LFKKKNIQPTTANTIGYTLSPLSKTEYYYYLILI